jgi:CRISPR-associated protein, GSU0054 family
MFGIKVEFLADRYTAHSKRGYGAPEWPPHPGRFYSALVAAYHEHDHGPEERDALEWLEELPPPRIHAPEARERDVVSVFVPHYDHDEIINQGGKQELIPQYRTSSNKERTFPTVIPDGSMHFIWDGTPGDETAVAINRLANSVPYFGDSSSLIHAQFEQAPPDPNYVPAQTGAGEEELRVVGAGRLAELEHAYETGQRPDPAKTVSYTTSLTPTTNADTQTSGFGTEQDLIILRIVDGPTPALEVSYDLITALRKALLAIIDDPVPSWISGHSKNNSDSDQPHIALLPLANIGHGWADGSVLGVGIAIPRHVSENNKVILYDAIQQLRPITVGSRGEVELQRVASPVKESLNRTPYTRESSLWTTVTPYVYERYPDTDDERDQMIAQSCEYIGLPHPSRVHVIEDDVSPIAGVANADDVRLTRTRFSNSPRRHIILRFDEPIRGPVSIGRGRFVGIGLMRALKQGDTQ